MFKHHRHSVEVHDVGGSSTFNNAPYAPPNAPAAVPTSATGAEPQAPAAAAPPAAAPTVTLPPDTLATGDLALDPKPTGKQPLQAFDDFAGEDGALDAQEAAAFNAYMKAQRSGSAAAPGAIPPIPPYDAADTRVGPRAPETEANQRELQAWFDGLPAEAQAQAREQGFPSPLAADGQEGPLTRAAANARAVLQHQAATEAQAAAAAEVEAAARAEVEACEAAAAQAEAAQQTPPEQVAAERIAALEAQVTQAQQAADEAVAGQAMRDLDDRLTDDGRGEAALALVNQRPDLLTSAFVEKMNGDAVQHLMQRLGEDEAERGTKLDQIPAQARGEMLRKYQAENNWKADKLLQSELAASLARTGQEVLADPFNFDLTTARFLGEEGKDNFDRLAHRR